MLGRIARTESINAAYCYNVVCVSLCVSVCLLATTVKRAKTDEPIVWRVDSGGTENLCITVCRSESLAPALLHDSPARRAILRTVYIFGRLWSTGNSRRAPKLCDRWQQRCGLSLSVLQQFVSIAVLEFSQHIMRNYIYFNIWRHTA